jgi:hypothetical protein
MASGTEMTTLKLELQKLQVLEHHNNIDKEIKLKVYETRIKINELEKGSKKRKSTSTTPNTKKRKTNVQDLPHIETNVSVVETNQVEVLMEQPTLGTNQLFVEETQESTSELSQESISLEIDAQSPQTVEMEITQNVLKEPDMSGWSKNKKRAWENKHRNENNFLCWFKPDGEEKRLGKWTYDEKVLLINEINKKYGKNQPMDWGIFSKRIPGRTGLQCRDCFVHIEKNQKKQFENSK